MSGIVYILTNPAMPGLVKIGKTSRNALTRMSELYSPGVPFPFECVMAREVKDAGEAEKKLHTIFQNSRVNANREFFEIDIVSAEIAMNMLSRKDATPRVQKSTTKGVSPTELNASKKYRSMRPRTNFFEMGMKKGSELIFTQGDISVTVFDEHKVIFNKEKTSLTPLTTKLLGRNYQVQPAGYWKFEKRLLSEIYEETYRSND